MLKISSKSISEHAEAPLADDGRLESLVAHWQQRNTRKNPLDPTSGNAAYVVSTTTDRDASIGQAALEEIVSLVKHQGDRVVGQETVCLPNPNARTLLGKGAAEEIAERARRHGADMLVLDAELSPSQTRNLEDVAGIPICDREAVILNVFRRHARTRRAKAQVEIAQLHYLRPRIRGVGINMDQQTGGMARARGPGETASELLARKLDARLAELQKSLAKVETSGATQRKARHDCKRIVLVGYTNAGKTSLMNALTSAELSARDMPFETLDTTSRSLARHGGDVVLCDTVGFIRRLPERLFASFESTLSEITDASLLVIVVDASDPERTLHLRTTDEAVARMGAREVPRFYVWNKIDLAGTHAAGEIGDVAGEHPSLVMSSRDPLAIAELREGLLRSVREQEETLSLLVPYSARELLAVIYATCRIEDNEAVDHGLALRLRAPGPVLARIRRLQKERTE